MTPHVVEERMGGHLTVIARDGEEVLLRTSQMIALRGLLQRMTQH